MDPAGPDRNACRDVQTFEVFDALRRFLPADAVLRRNEPLDKRTTLRAGGPADIYFEPPTVEALQLALDLCARFNTPWTAIGRGSNLLIRDGGIRGLVLSLQQPAFSALEFDGERVEAGAGVRLKNLAVEARKRGLSGFEFLEGIPGSLGGALRMNAGAMGSWAFDVVDRVRFVDGEGRLRDEPASAMQARYRECPLLRGAIAVGAILHGHPDDADAIAHRMETNSRRRWETQPNQPSAGCIFKNPGPNLPAGRLIEELGLKGARVGAAMVSDVHANFIVNLGGAAAADVLALIEMVRDRALKERGVALETEVEILGEGPAS
jgi:UDP-N-acetylenolpyruvoylglucosamine reductase